MKEILLLFSSQRKDPTDADSPETIANKLVDILNQQNKGAKYSYALYEDLVHRIDNQKASITDSKSGHDIASYSAVYQRQYAMAPEDAAACATYLSSKSIPFVDSESNTLGFWGKLSGYWRLLVADLPIPRTFYVGGNYLKKWVQDELQNSLSFPAILKSNYGRRGRENHLVHSSAEALEIINAASHTSFIFQEFIPNKLGYRIWVCGDKVSLVIERRPSEDSHLNNGPGSMGKQVDIVSIPKKMRDDAVKSARVLGREIAGIDIIVHKESPPDRFFFLEVNRAPQVFTRVTSSQKAKALDEFLRSISG